MKPIFFAVLATTLICLAAAVPAAGADLPHSSAGWAFVEIARPANADDAAWARTIATAAERLRRIQATDGSQFFKDLQKLLPNATLIDINDRLTRSVEINHIKGTALLEVRFAISDDSAAAARATTLVVEEFLRRTEDPAARAGGSARLVQPVTER